MNVSRRPRRLALSVLIGVIAIALPVVGQCADISVDPSNYRSALASLNPGDTLVLAPGTYTRAGYR